MNYLAHFHLAWPDPGLIAGALEGDYRKGPLRGELPAPVERGIRLHRAVDAYTDSHPLIETLRRQFPDGLRRYAGILIDLSFDHFLCRHWQRFNDLPRASFNQLVYRELAGAQADLSPPARRMAQRMSDIDLLDHYARWDTIPASAARIGERLKRGNPFLDAERDLAPHRDAIEQAFLAFYPQLFEFARSHHLP
ncbi:ACP phosphodiesterase [Haliea sp. E17]|uniref:acyl carrier protein phosphodiesterase n=1 Tax=Haliea sp. E17 TaxID=3401576 RepID=UPI003AAAE877